MSIYHINQQIIKLIDEFEKTVFDWRIIKDFPNYRVCKLGLVQNIKTNRILKFCKDKKGYLLINLCNNGIAKHMRVHRLVAHAYLDNPENKLSVDHINNIKSDNRLENLRFASRQEQQHNIGIPKNNTSGVKGVYYDKSRNYWRAIIYINGKRIHLGYYKTLEEAKLVRQQKAREIFGEFTNICEL